MQQLVEDSFDVLFLVLVRIVRCLLPERGQRGCVRLVGATTTLMGVRIDTYVRTFVFPSQLLLATFQCQYAFGLFIARPPRE